MSASPCKLASPKHIKSGGCQTPVLGILIFGFLLMCASSALAHDESLYENVNVNGIELNGFEVFALEQATGKDIPNGNYWYEMATGKWGYVGGPAEGYFNLPDSFKEYIAAQKEDAAKSPTEFAQAASYLDCDDDCWF